jgi:hypothetical protein
MKDFMVEYEDIIKLAWENIPSVENEFISMCSNYFRNLLQLSHNTMHVACGYDPLYF